MRLVRVLGRSALALSLALALALLLAGAVLLTALRVLQPHGGLWVRGVAFAPYAVPAYAVVLVACLVGARRRRVLLLAAAGALVGLGVHGWWLAPYYTAVEAPAADEHLTVMTVNVLGGGADPAEVVRVAADHDVDLLAVQEIDPSTLLAMEEAGLNAHLPHHVGEASWSASSTMLFARVPLGEPRPIETTWDSFAVDADTGTRLGGGPVTVVVTHPQSPHPDDGPWRDDLAVLHDALEAEAPDLVLGDFNATPDHEPFRALLETGLRDVAEQAGEGWQRTWPANGLYRLGGLVPVPVLVPIDHVLVGEGWRGMSSRTVAVPGTDHLALLAHVTPRRAAP